MLLRVGHASDRSNSSPPIDTGGTGEVYKARHTRLDRRVAIKVLFAHVSADPERRARFEGLTGWEGDEKYGPLPQPAKPTIEPP